MAVPALDRKTALLTADRQKGITGSPFIRPIGEVVERACSLSDALPGLHLPVVRINVAEGAPGRTEQPQRHDGPFPADFTEVFPRLGETGTALETIDLLSTRSA